MPGPPTMQYSELSPTAQRRIRRMMLKNPHAKFCAKPTTNGHTIFIPPPYAFQSALWPISWRLVEGIPRAERQGEPE